MSIAALIEAVEAGAATMRDFIDAFGRVPMGNDIEAYNAYLGSLDAYLGSLDAAKALHDALLPGWFYCLMDGVAEVRGEMEYGDRYVGKSTDPARAWLLAILRAKEAVE